MNRERRIFRSLLVWGLLASTVHTMAETNGQLNQIALKSCVPASCFEVKAERGEQGSNPNLISLDHLVLTVIGNGISPVIFKDSPVQANDGYYDALTSLVVLRGVQKKKYSELVLDLTSGEIDTY